MTIKAIIFDVGGVLAYDVWEHLFFEPDGVVALYKLNADVANKTGTKLWNEFAHQNTDINNGWQKLESDYWQRFIEQLHLETPTEKFIQLTDKFIKPVTGMSKLLESLRAKKIDLAICSNNTEFWFERQRRKLEFDKFFETDKTILSSRVGVSKNSVDFEMFQAVINALNVDKQDCLFIDDKEENILRALRYGIAGILFPSHSEFGAGYLHTLFMKMGIL